MQIDEHVPLAPLTTLGIGGPARYMVTASTEAELVQAVQWAGSRSLPLFVLGGGSNLLVPDQGFPGLVLRLALLGIDSPAPGCFEVGAGESWDGFVDQMVARDLAGIECLTGIPGSVGGTPVQNVGAYGQEVAETIETVRAFDRHTAAFLDLPRSACNFRYRESLFNADQPGRYIVTRVRFRLLPGGAPSLRYRELQSLFAGRPQPTLAEVAAAVRSARQRKGMLLVPGDPDCRSAGSFFKNPIVPAAELLRIAKAADVPPGHVPHWTVPRQCIKLPAAWLLERAGFHKGYALGAAGLSSRHTLALINRGGATCADVQLLERRILAAVEERFGLRLEREPVLLTPG